MKISAVDLFNHFGLFLWEFDEVCLLLLAFPYKVNQLGNPMISIHLDLEKAIGVVENLRTGGK